MLLFDLTRKPSINQPVNRQREQNPLYFFCKSYDSHPFAFSVATLSKTTWDWASAYSTNLALSDCWEVDKIRTAKIAALTALLIATVATGTPRWVIMKVQAFARLNAVSQRHPETLGQRESLSQADEFGQQPFLADVRLLLQRL